MKLGTDEFGKVFLGDDFVERIYQGDDQIYSIYKDSKDAEIVFRPTDNKGQLSVADPYFGYAKIDSIKGKSLVWNQHLVNGNFSSSAGWNVVGGTLSVANNIATLTADGSYYYIQLMRFDYALVPGHKFLYIAIIKATAGRPVYFSSFHNNDDTTSTGNWQRISYIETLPSSNITNGYPRIAMREVSSGDTLQCSFFIMVDLTLMFGQGHEPSTVAEFEAMFPLPYYSYNAGTIINNDAQSLKTVGFNQWDEEWERGGFDLSTLVFTPSAIGNFIISKNFCDILPNTTYYTTAPYNIAGFGLYRVLYDANKNALYRESYTAEFTTPQNARYFKIAVPINNGYGSSTYNNDICINLSDPSKNGTYEPYWESTLPLNLDYLPIKSHNIWDEEWELGYLDQHTGEPIDGNGKRAKNFINVFPSTTYYGKSVATGMRIFEYDANKNFLTCNTVVNNGTFVTSNNTYFIKFQDATPSYNHDICINPSDPDFNGQYEPYALRGGLKGTGSVYDLGRVEDDGYIHEVTKVMGEVDLGSLNWKTESEGALHANYNYKLPDIVNYTTVAIAGPILSGGGYNVVPRSAFDGTSAAITKSVATNYKYIMFTQDSYASATAFKTAMNGIKLIYELATPITYELVTPIKAIYKVDKRGTEQATFPTHSDGTPSTPLCVEIGYPK